MSAACEICGAKPKAMVEVPLIRVPEGCLQKWLEEAEAQRAKGMERALYTTRTCGESACKDTAMRSGAPGRSYPEWRAKGDA